MALSAAVLIKNGSYSLGTFKLENVNIEVKKGSVVALIGSSGKGRKFNFFYTAKWFKNFLSSVVIF